MRRAWAACLLAVVCACNPIKPSGARAQASASAANEAVGALPPVAGPDERLEPLRQRTYAVVIDGTLAHVGTEAGVTVFDVAKPEEPKALAQLTLPGSVNNVALLEGSPTLAVALGPSGLALVDTAAARSGRISLWHVVPWSSAQRGECHAVWKAVSGAGGTGYAACGTGGLAELDLRDKAKPAVTRVLAVGDYARDVAVIDPDKKLVVVAAGHAGVVIAGMGAGAPRVLASVATEGDSRALAVRDGLVFVAEGAAGMRIIDIHDPAKPKVVGSVRPAATDMMRGVTVGPRIAWLCAGESGVFSVDISEPASPRQVGAYDPERAVNRAALMGDTVVAANDSDGLLLLDGGNPAAPRLIHPKPPAGP